jgi:hypothetical protein
MGYNVSGFVSFVVQWLPYLNPALNALGVA